MQKRTEKKMKITVINKHGDLPKSKSISFLENSEIFQQIQKLIKWKTQ